MTIEFKDAAVPTTTRVGRKPLPNPFTDLFPLADGKAKTFVIVEAPDSTEAKRIVRQVRQAAKAVNRSGRVDMQVVPEGTQVTVWDVEAVTRKVTAPAPAAKAPAKKATAKPSK